MYRLTLWQYTVRHRADIILALSGTVLMYSWPCPWQCLGIIGSVLYSVQCSMRIRKIVLFPEESGDIDNKGYEKLLTLSIF